MAQADEKGLHLWTFLDDYSDIVRKKHVLAISQRYECATCLPQHTVLHLGVAVTDKVPLPFAISSFDPFIVQATFESSASSNFPTFFKSTQAPFSSQPSSNSAVG